MASTFGQKMVALKIGSYKGYGTLKLKSGELINDTLHYGFADPYRVFLSKKKANDPLELPKKFSPGDVEYFTIGDTTFVSVKTGQAITGTFMIRITPADYKIQVLKTYEQSEDKTRIITKYYALFPGQKNAKDIMNDLSLMPFAGKVSKLIADCPDLSAKVKNKEAPYKIPTLSNEKNFFEVIMKVADAYQTCN